MSRIKLYNELAEWWPWMSPHTEYEEEASLYLEIIQRYHPNVKRALEFGAGGGSNAFYLKQHFAIVLTGLSNEMLEVSRQLNPDCENLQGDMRSSIGSMFDLVFVHDVITYFTDTEDLLAVMKNEKGEIFREWDSSRSGLFSMKTWEELLAAAGFKATFERIHYTAESGI